MIETWWGVALRDVAPHVAEAAVGVLLPELAQKLGENAVFFYSRLYEEVPVLKLYVKLTGASEQEAARQQEHWLAWIRKSSADIAAEIVEHPYVPQTERYGGEEMLVLIEHVFTQSALLAAELFAAGCGIEDKVAAALKINEAVIRLLPLGGEARGRFLQGAKDTWAAYYRACGYPFSGQETALLAQLRACLLEATQPVDASPRFQKYEQALHRVRDAAAGLDCRVLLETPPHSDSLRAILDELPQESAAYAQIAVSLLHMTFNKFGFFGELETLLLLLLFDEATLLQKG